MRFASSWIVRTAFALAIVVAPALALAEPRASMRVSSREVYAGMPFELSVEIEGLNEAPAPAQPAVQIDGAVVQAAGVTPSVSTKLTIINGRRTRTQAVNWVLTYRVESATAGTLKVPPITVEQGGIKVTAPGGEVRLRELPRSDDMRIELSLPNRPVWVGETIAAEIQWLLARQAGGPQFSLPVLAQDADLVITPPAPTQGQETVRVTAGARTVELPYTRDAVEIDGRTFTRFRLPVLLAPKRAGAIALAPATVVAEVEVGGQRDFFGNSATRLHRAADVARTLEVRDLPAKDRPPGFAGAVGTSFSMTAQTSRSVVQLGEPVDLTITVRGDQRLDTLALGPLTGAGGLPAAIFAVPQALPPGELSADGTSKTFRVPLQVIGPATEVPALALAYFDPVAAQYKTVHSEPIALSVKGQVAKVGAGDVVAATPQPGATGVGAGPVAEDLVGADLALSAPGQTLSTSGLGSWIWGVIAALYAVPLAVFGWRWQARRRAARQGDSSEFKAARGRVRQALARARTEAARDSAGELLAALRALRKAGAPEPALDTLIDRVERDGFAPEAARGPLSTSLLDDVAAAVDRVRLAPARALSTVAMLLGLVLVSWPGRAWADPIDRGRTAYQNALTATGETRRLQFQTAHTQLAEAVRLFPGRVDLLADLGNAALGAGDVGAATLAYLRALRIDPDHPRAARNLAWLRTRQADAMRRDDRDAADAFLFFASWSRPMQALLGALCFALMIGALLIWRERGRRGYLVAAIPMGLAWLALSVAAVVPRSPSQAAVVMTAQVLRAADSMGAPAAMAAPVPAGTEVDVIETRAGWRRIRVGDRQVGWLPAGAVEPVE